MKFDPMTSQFWYEIGVSLLCGSIIGIEREIRGKPTGNRTCVLIFLVTALFVRMGNLVATDHSDPTRVVGQVVTGIGFLGGGVILAPGEVVTGVTTASVVWWLAEIGTEGVASEGSDNAKGTTIVSGEHFQPSNGVFAKKVRVGFQVFARQKRSGQDAPVVRTFATKA